ncbi:phosphoadenosine phosphosulfate reductase domain-containing protein [Paenibacillus aestuarii]|uniref:Phosphoadenosine phosphosulfate reductase family protein n=1 Tax=Paenibacillus aestuarii TaxID=516965 RepID=A0ABW0KHY0_9BACL|nr:phosphoadenosine phosphosulfate reductase family protein [Paenibacillus aestuarii]
MKAVEALNLDIEFIIVEPEVENSYFSMVIGRGYIAPSVNFKWCVDRLKILPGRKALLKLVESGETVCQVLGSRSYESTQRASSIQSEYGDDFYGAHVVHGSIRTAAPIKHWTAHNVVTYLVHNPAPYDYSNYHLLNLYGSAAGGMEECPLGAAMQDASEGISSCGGKKSRFGCWSCTEVSEDISLKNLAFGDYPDLEPYYHTRTVFKLT